MPTHIRSVPIEGLESSTTSSPRRSSVDTDVAGLINKAADKVSFYAKRYLPTSQRAVILSLAISLPLAAYFNGRQHKVENMLSSPHILTLPNAKFSPSPDYTDAFIDLLGERGREVFADLQITDAFWAVIQSLAFASILGFLKGPVISSLLLPLGFLISNLVENAALLHLSTNFPNTSRIIAFMAVWATRFKWIHIGLFLSLVFSKVVLKAMRRVWRFAMDLMESRSESKRLYGSEPEEDEVEVTDHRRTTLRKPRHTPPE